MGDLDRKREAIKDAYPSESWSERVDKMSDAQVIAIHSRLRAQGKIR